jgi:hypothetical protein
MTEWTQERIDEQKKICALNTEIAYSLKYIEAARLNYEAAISEIERLQLLVGELVETLDGITKNWAFDEADLTALIKEAQEAIK